MAVLVSFLVFLNSCSMLEVNELVDRNNAISNNVITPLWDSLSTGYSEDESVIVLRISESRIRASILYKGDFSWYLSDKSDKIFGLAKYNKIPVLVFGEESSCDKFFKRTGGVQDVEYLKYMHVKKEISNPEIEIEPDMFEPIVWYFSTQNDQFKLLEKGSFILLE